MAGPMLGKRRTFLDVSKNTTRDGEPWEQLSHNTDHMLLLDIYAECHTLIKGVAKSRAEVEEIYSRIQVMGRDQCLHMGPSR